MIPTTDEDRFVYEHPRYQAAAKSSAKWAERRAALPPGSSRARVTTANAGWARAAEERDRVAAELRAEWRGKNGGAK